MQNELSAIETQRNQLLQARLDQLQEILSAKKEQLKELYQLLKFRDSLGDLLHASTTDGNLAPEEDDAGCNAFVELYEHGGISDFTDWPISDESSAVSLSRETLEPSPLLSERVLAVSPPAPSEPLVPSAPVSPAVALSPRLPSLPPPAASPSHLSPPSLRSPTHSPIRSLPTPSPAHSPPAAPTVPQPSPLPPHSPPHSLPRSPPRSPARSPSRSPPRPSLPSPPSPSLPLPSPPHSPPSVSPLPLSSPLPPPSPSPPSSPSLSSSPSRSPSAKPVPELPYDESQDVDRFSDLASEAAPRQEVLIPSSPEPSPETRVPVKDSPIEEETVEPKMVEAQPPLSETTAIDETVIQQTAVGSLPPSPDVMEEVVMEEQGEAMIEDEDEPTIIVQSVLDHVRSSPVHEIVQSSSPMAPSEMPSPEETEAIAVKSDGDEDEEEAVSQSVVAEPDLRESPDRDLETHVASRAASPEVVAEEPAVSPVAEETTAEEVEEATEAAVLPSEVVDQTDQEVEMDVDYMEEEQDIEYGAGMKTDAAVEQGVSDIEEIEEDVREEDVSVPPEVSETPAQGVAEEDQQVQEETAEEGQQAQEETAEEDQQVQEETAEEDQQVLVVEETVPDKESPPTPPPPPDTQETDSSGLTNAVQVFDDYVEEGILSPIEDAQLPLLRPMGLIPSPEEFDSPTRSPSGSLTRSPSIVPEIPSSQVGSHVGIEDDVQPIEEAQETQETREIQETQEVEETKEAQETQEENVYTGRVTRSRSHVLTDSPALKTQRIATKSPSLKDEFRKAELEQPEVEVDEVANETVIIQDIDEGRELSVVSEVQDVAVSRQVSDERREASVVSLTQDTAVSRQVSEERNFDHPQSIEASVSPAVMESLAASPESDVDMEDADVPQNMPEEPPSPVSLQASRDELADQTDVKMEGDQTPLNVISPNLLFRFPPVSPRPSQSRTLLLDAVPSTISGIRSILFDYSASAEQNDEDEKSGVQALDAQTLPDTTLPPMPMSPMLTPYVNSISLPEDLPATLARKVHPAKLARKRDRERERDAKEDNKDKKDLVKGAWLPWEVSRWGAHIRANAAHKMVRRTGKVLTTKMWNVAHNELKLSRTLERIERLKQEGRWSFRQPKKQKGPLVSKSHWDWMLDEMKWMSTDFREERIWKTTVTFNLAHDVRLWHSATPEERKMLCVPRSAVQRGIDNFSLDVEPAGAKTAEQHIVDKPLGTVELPSVEDMINQTPEGPWQLTEELDVEKEANLILKRQREQRNDDEAKDQGEQDSLDADGEDDADGEMDVDVEEEVEPVFDLPAAPVVDAEESQPTQVPESSQEIAVETPLSTEIGLKNLSSDLSAGPVLSSAPEKLPGTTVTDAVKSHVRTSLHNMADDELFLDIEELCSGLSLSTLDDHTSLDLPELFSDYQIYQPLFPSPELAETAVLPRTDKKAEKKERKVIEELTRVDETTLSKVVNVSTFMQYRPLLVSALQPAKRYRDGKWINLEDSVVSSDDTAAVAAAEPPPDHLFGPQRTRPLGVSLYSLGTRMPKDGQKRVNETPWSNSEDLLLKDIAERYPNNWGLIADVFNSSRVTITNDQRTGWDCMVRWDLRWNEGKLLTPPAVPTTPEVSVSDIPNPTQTPLHGQAVLNALMTRKRSVGQLSLTLPSQPAESRKRRRHNHMHEAMKKSAKKRETSMKQIIPNRRPNAQVHETHNAFKQPAHRTPAELSRLKAEKDRREFEEQQLRRKQQEEEIIRKRQMELRQQQQQQMQSAQPVSLPHVRGPNHPQVNISQQAARLPNAAGGNLPVPNVPQNPQIPAGVNLNTPSLPRFTPEQQRAFQMQMHQARLVQAQAQAQAQLQQAQAQAQRSPVQQQIQQLGQPSQQQPQPQLQPQPHPQSQPQPQQPQQLHSQQQPQVQPQQQHQQQPNMSTLGNAVPNAAQHVMPGTPVVPTHPAMHPSHSSPIPAQATIHHSAVAQITPPRLGTPGNVNVNLMGMNAGTQVVRSGMPQIAQQQRPGSTPQMPSVPSQPPRPTSTQLPLQVGQMAGQMMRQTTLQQHQHQQQQAMHHASMQNIQNMQNMHNGLTQEQIKRLYHSQLYWGNPQMHAAAANAQMAYAQSPPQQPQTPQQQISSPRPPSVQPHSNITPSPAPPS